MGIKNVFKKIWHGVTMAEPYFKLAGQLLPPPFGLLLSGLDELVSMAETKFPAQGTGVEKAAFVEEKFLAAAELFTGKNVNNPSTRALVAEINSVVVQTKNLAARYQELVEDLKDAIDSVKDPAIPDDAPQP